MNPRNGSRVPRVQSGERGQALVMVLVVLVGLLAAAALTIDMGNLYYSYTELLSATQAAAKAGGQAIPNWAITSPTTVADNYSGSTAAGALYNINPNLNITSVTVNYACVSTTTYPNLGLPPCSTYNAAAGSVNAIQVTEKASVPTFFAKFFGVTKLDISATATASASGGGAIPYNVMMVLDTTASMGSGSDTGCVKGSSGALSPEGCAQNGVQTLLSYLAPCATSLASCGSNPPVDQVGLMVFPGLCSDTTTGVTTATCAAATTLTDTTANPTYAPDDWACPAVNPPIAKYNNNPAYLILGFQNDYRTSDAAALNTSSKLFKTVGAGTNSCGMPTPGGEGTFYAGAITAASNYLYANHRNNVQDVMILLSDGNATASATQMGGTVTSYSPTAECQQAVAAADSAKGAPYNILIYSISYGSETSGCTAGDTLTPCQTMSGIASLPLSTYFFSVPQTVNGKTSTVCSGAVPITQLDQVFTTIAGDLESSRLIPNSVF
ncbi:MAG TPA: TadG family pilus assembly protein [Terriglobia bacterium]|nr:TadG family pilus assembly protein [Terriglobia bacterium]